MMDSGGSFVRHMLNAFVLISVPDMDIAVVVSVSATVDILGLIAASHRLIQLHMSGPHGSNHQ